MKEFTNKPEVFVDTLFFASQCCVERTMVITKLPLNVWIREEFHSIWGLFYSLLASGSGCPDWSVWSLFLAWKTCMCWLLMYQSLKLPGSPSGEIVYNWRVTWNVLLFDYIPLKSWAFPSFISEFPSVRVINNTELAESLPMSCFRIGLTETRREARGHLFKLDTNVSTWHFVALPWVLRTPKHLQELWNWCGTSKPSWT